MITIYVPGLPLKSYEYRRGDAQIIHDDKKNAIVIDGGEPDLCNKLIAYCRKVGITHITYVLTHWHVDHDKGMQLFLDVSGIFVDRIYCPPPSELKGLQESGVTDDYSRACRRIAQAEKLRKPIVYPVSGIPTDINVGDIRCRIWRRKANKSDFNDYEVNNTSMVTYFPDLLYLTSGDTINSFDIYLGTYKDTVKVFKIPHHGNASTTNPCQKLKAYGAELCWYNDFEPKGTSVGGTGFSKWGAGYCKKYFTTIRTDADVYMVADSGKLTVTKGSTKWTYDIPYNKGRWVEYDQGWKYIGADGKELKDGPYKIDGNWYYFDKDGYRMEGWVLDSDGQYRYCAPYMLIRTFVDVDGNRYYLDGYGRRIENQWYQVDTKWYSFDPSGAMRFGWYADPELGLRYLEPTKGYMYVNTTAMIDGKNYVFDGYGRVSEATGKYPRRDIVSLAQGLVGVREGTAAHHGIIDKYNTYRPLPRGYKVKYTDAWCAAFCSYLAIASGYTDIIPIECGCPQWVTIAKGKGIWQESDAYKPKPGDFVLYDWQDSGSGDNTGTPDHIGIVEKVEGSTITVIEGNYSDMVKRRQIQVNGRNIRGYVCPKYSD